MRSRHMRLSVGAISALLGLWQNGSAAHADAPCCELRDRSGKTISPLEVILPTSLVMHPSEVVAYNLQEGIFYIEKQNEKDFSIALQDSNLVIIRTSLRALGKNDDLYGALVSMDGNGYPPFGKTSTNEKIRSIINSKHKMVAMWHSSPDASHASPEVDWETVQEAKSGDGKWEIAGAAKKQGVITEYLIIKEGQSVWISKEEALKLALEGKIDIFIASN